MDKRILQYGQVKLADINFCNTEDIKISCGEIISFAEENCASNIRIKLPSLCTEAIRKIHVRGGGYVFGDRTISTVINLRQDSNINCEFASRFDIQISENCTEEIINIAKNSFPFDRRFHIRPEYDNDLAEKVITDWIGKLKAPFVCIHKGKVIGFLYLEQVKEDTAFITLSAVSERYRASGAAMAIYANAINYAKEKGLRKIEGRISSLNMAVMNLYAYFGAKFSQPEDIYLKEIEHEG